MKKIINGRMYNTETAKKVDEYWNGYAMSDFNYLSETLYKKRNGEFFLHGCGHGFTKYAEHFGDSYGYGEKIIPLTYEEARAWAEEKADTDAYEEVFELNDEPITKEAVFALLDSLEKREAFRAKRWTESHPEELLNTASKRMHYNLALAEVREAVERL